MTKTTLKGLYKRLRTNGEIRSHVAADNNRVDEILQREAADVARELANLQNRLYGTKAHMSGRAPLCDEKGNPILKGRKFATEILSDKMSQRMQALGTRVGRLIDLQNAFYGRVATVGRRS